MLMIVYVAIAAVLAILLVLTAAAALPQKRPMTQKNMWGENDYNVYYAV